MSLFFFNFRQRFAHHAACVAYLDRIELARLDPTLDGARAYIELLSDLIYTIRFFIIHLFCLPSVSVTFVPTFGDYQCIIGMKCYFSSLAQYAYRNADRSWMRVQKITCGFDLIHSIGENLGGVTRSQIILHRNTRTSPSPGPNHRKNPAVKPCSQ